MSAQPIRLDDDPISTTSRERSPRRRQKDRPDGHWSEASSMALLSVRSPVDLDGSLPAVTALLASRRLAGVFDVIAGAFIGRRGGVGTLQEWTSQDLVGDGHVVRNSCTFGGRWSLTWFDAPAPGAGNTTDRRRQLLAALGWSRRTRLSGATFVPVLGPDEGRHDGGAAVVAELATRHPDLRFGQGVLLHDPIFGIICRG